MKRILLLLAFGLIMEVGFSSEEDESAIQLQLAWSDRIEAIKKTISEHAPVAAAELKQVKINPVDSGDIGRVYAYRRDGLDNIDISLGFLAMLNHLVTAFDSLPTSQAVSYLNFYVRKLEHPENADKYAGPIQDPLDRAGWSKEEKECVENDSDKINEIGRLETATAAFVICHELGHLVLGHWKTPPASPAESQARETAADKFASDTLIASDIGPIVGMYALI